MNEQILVNKKALRQVLLALVGPPHLIRELQVLNVPLFPDNPIEILVDDYNKAIVLSESNGND